MIRTGRVIKIENGRPMVCFDRLETCEKCAGCLDNKKQALVRVLGQAEPGDSVDVELPDHQILGLSIVMYAIPLAGLLIGLLMGNAVFAQEWQTLLCGFAGLALCFGIVRAIDGRIQNNEKWQPHIVQRQDEERT